MGLTAIGTALGASAANAAAVGAAVISTTTAVASGAANYVQQVNNAEAQQEYQDQVNQQITEATIENYKELSKVEQDVLYNTSQDSLEHQIAALQNASSQVAMSSASGISGGSADARMREIARLKDKGDTDIRMAREQQLRNIDAQAKSLQQGAKASYLNAPIQKPSVWGAVAQGAQSGASMFTGSLALDKAWRDSSKVGSGV